ACPLAFLGNTGTGTGTMSLRQAITELLAFIDALSESELIPYSGEGWDRFAALDRAVYNEAVKLGWEGRLPSDRPGEDKPLGMTRLPGFRLVAGFCPARLYAWKTHLHALAEVAPADVPVVPDSSPQLHHLERLTERIRGLFRLVQDERTTHD